MVLFCAALLAFGPGTSVAFADDTVNDDPPATTTESAATTTQADTTAVDALDGTNSEELPTVETDDASLENASSSFKGQDGGEGNQAALVEAAAQGNDASPGDAHGSDTEQGDGGRSVVEELEPSALAVETSADKEDDTLEAEAPPDIVQAEPANVETDTVSTAPSEQDTLEDADAVAADEAEQAAEASPHPAPRTLHPDPYFFVNGDKHSFLPAGGDCAGVQNCAVSDTPIQDALNAVGGGLTPDDGTIYVEGGIYDEDIIVEDVVVDLAIAGSANGKPSVINGAVKIQNSTHTILMQRFTINAGMTLMSAADVTLHTTTLQSGLFVINSNLTVRDSELNAGMVAVNSDVQVLDSAQNAQGATIDSTVTVVDAEDVGTLQVETLNVEPAEVDDEGATVVDAAAVINEPIVEEATTVIEETPLIAAVDAAEVVIEEQIIDTPAEPVVEALNVGTSHVSTSDVGAPNVENGTAEAASGEPVTDEGITITNSTLHVKNSVVASEITVENSSLNYQGTANDDVLEINLTGDGNNLVAVDAGEGGDTVTVNLNAAASSRSQVEIMDSGADEAQDAVVVQAGAEILQLDLGGGLDPLLTEIMAIETTIADTPVVEIEVQAEEPVSIVDADVIINTGTIENLTVEAGQADLRVASPVKLTGDIILDAEIIEVTATLSSTEGGDIQLAAVVDVLIEAHIAASGGDGEIAISAGSDVVQEASSTVSAVGEGSISLTAGTVDPTGSITIAGGLESEDGDISLRAAGDVVLTDSAHVSTGADLIVEADMDGDGLGEYIAQTGAVVTVAGDTRIIRARLVIVNKAIAESMVVNAAVAGTTLTSTLNLPAPQNEGTGSGEVSVSGAAASPPTERLPANSTSQSAVAGIGEEQRILGIDLDSAATADANANASADKTLLDSASLEMIARNQYLLLEFMAAAVVLEGKERGSKERSHASGLTLFRHLVGTTASLDDVYAESAGAQAMRMAAEFVRDEAARNPAGGTENTLVAEVANAASAPSDAASLSDTAALSSDDEPPSFVLSPLYFYSFILNSLKLMSE